LGINKIAKVTGSYVLDYTAITPQAKQGFDRWLKSTLLENQLDIFMFRVLGCLFDDCGRLRGHTKSKIAERLNLWDDRVGETLNRLEGHEYIHSERVSYGIDHLGRMRTIMVYQLTEIGRFLLNQVDTQFPGLWLSAI